MTDGWGFVISEIPIFPLWVQNVLCVLFFALVCCMIYWITRPYLGQETWHEYRAPPWKHIVYLDGSTEWAPMPCFRRRNRSGEWEYRPHNAVEMKQWNKDQAI